MITRSSASGTRELTARGGVITHLRTSSRMDASESPPEKGLRSEKIEMSTGTRLVMTNDAGVRMQDLLDLVTEHSPKHTSPFMNLVLGSIESDAGAEGLREDVLLVTVKKS